MASVLQLISTPQSPSELKQFHAQIIKLGLSYDNDAMGRVIKFCAISESGNFNYALQVFDKLPKPDPFIYNTDAQKVFDNMSDRDDVSWTTLISGYAQLGYLEEAFRVFDSIPEKSSVCWNAIISAYVQSNKFHEAFSLFERMMSEDVVVDKFLAASMLSACTRLGALKQGEWIVEYVKKRGVDLDSKLATTIIDMYCKCGCLDKAVQFFKRLPRKGISSWNCMIGGLAMHGKGEAAIEVLKEMQSERVAPDYITFVNLLSACAYSGLVEEGKHYFPYMKEVYGIEPGMEHYGCLVDLLGRAGLLEEARRVINEMPMSPDVGVLGALLGAFRIHKNIELEEMIGKQRVHCRRKNSSSSQRDICQSNEMLDRIESAGYVPDSDGIQQDIDEEESENPLNYHSEKLAIAFGLLKSKPGEILRITKNLRVCKDCHQASKLISKVYDRKIII
ncbi:hypothetical protein RND71_004905 [Anisodus tanguticus]|uniref:DYW domain-containing protein n=1 Tax=Anisodus tanguticus TaxID=243964 RepID=A0AAE1VL06_9SOLA|nr:hypothetical protein RND71_004905 [Anisodus tanguticus]